MTAQLTPPFAYFGGKTVLGDRIAEHLPPHQHYVEPFAGGLSVLFAKRPSTMETVNDLDGRLMLFWRVLRDHSSELERVCALTPHSRAEYMACQDVAADPLDDELETARRVWVRLAQGRGGTQKKTGWRSYQVPRGSSIGMPGYLEAYVGRMAPVAERLARVSLESRPAVEVIETYGRVPHGVVLYVDPPYLGSTRSGTNYLVDMPGVAAHEELLAAIARCKAPVLLSGYDNSLYADALRDWPQVRWTTTTNGPDGSRGYRTEVLWSNRELNTDPSLFDEVETTP